MRYRGGYVLVGVLVILHGILHWGTGGAAGVRPERIAGDPIADVRERDPGTVRQVEMLEGEDLSVLFQERFVDRGPNVSTRSRTFGDVTSVAPPRPMVPQSGRQNDAGASADDGFSGLLPGRSGERERSGWGWLSDDVQQMRGAGTAGGEGTVGPIELPRRFGDTDEGFSARRWLEE